MSRSVEADSLSQRFRVPRGFGDLLRRRPAREVMAVDSVSLQVGDGEIMGLVGPNGAGKTTFINLLSTLVIPSSGTARVGGHDVVTEPKQVRRLIGVVSSNERSFFWRLSARQNLYFFAELYRVPPPRIGPWIEELLEALDLRDFGDTRFDRFSTGMRQRLSFARALLHRPVILFMDEPTKGLDPNSAAGLLRLLRERIIDVWSPTIIITSHDFKVIEKLCHRIAIMHRGHIPRVGTLDELRKTVAAASNYRLSVAKLSPRDLAGAVPHATLLKTEEEQTGGAPVLEIRVSGAGGALAETLRALVSLGGEVQHCDEEPVSLEDVFSDVMGSEPK